MSTSYEREIEDGDQVADYDGDYREPYATRLYLMLEKKYAKPEALDALRVVKEYEVSLSEIHSPRWDFGKRTEDFSEKWRALDNGRKTQNPESHDCMRLFTFLQESKIPARSGSHILCHISFARVFAICKVIIAFKRMRSMAQHLLLRPSLCI